MLSDYTEHKSKHYGKGYWHLSFCTVSVQVRILSTLDHPSIIHYYGTARESNFCFVVTGLLL